MCMYTLHRHNHTDFWTHTCTSAQLHHNVMSTLTSINISIRISRICGWAGLKGGILWGMEFREKGTFKSETRFAPLLILSRRLVSVSADSEKLRFEPAHISHDPLARPVGAQNPSPSLVSYIIMSLVHSYQPEFTLYLHKSLRMACNRPKQSILLTVNICS